jgi:hypothetical protein
MRFFILEKPEHPWGDYYDILLHGMSCHSGRSGGRIQLERTGPFVPPISLPGISDIVVMDEFRRKLEGSGLQGFHFLPVVKRRIVHLEWHTWDQSKDEPPFYPENGEPEEYILDLPHSPALSKQIGELWQVVLKPSAQVRRINLDRQGIDCEILLEECSWRGEDLFMAEGVGYIYVTERGKDWLESNADGYVAFSACKKV